MRVTSSKTKQEQLLVALPDLMNMLGVGRFSAEKIAENANAVVRVGRRKLYSVAKIKKHIEEVTE